MAAKKFLVGCLVVMLVLAVGAVAAWWFVLRPMWSAGVEGAKTWISAVDLGNDISNQSPYAPPADGRMTPAQVLKLKVDDMRAAGLSARKVEYLVDLALHFSNGQVHEKQWADMDDEAIIAELVAIRGIGRWTAEMFLIFHLMRPNVLPLDDIGLQNGISRCYFSGEPVSRSEIREVATSWAPYCSVATWYIWRSLDPVPVSY